MLDIRMNEAKRETDPIYQLSGLQCGHASNWFGKVVTDLKPKDNVATPPSNEEGSIGMGENMLVVLNKIVCLFTSLPTTFIEWWYQIPSQCKAYSSLKDQLDLRPPDQRVPEALLRHIAPLVQNIILRENGKEEDIASNNTVGSIKLLFQKMDFPQQYAWYEGMKHTNFWQLTQSKEDKQDPLWEHLSSLRTKTTEEWNNFLKNSEVKSSARKIDEFHWGILKETTQEQLDAPFSSWPLRSFTGKVMGGPCFDHFFKRVRTERHPFTLNYSADTPNDCDGCNIQLNYKSHTFYARPDILWIKCSSLKTKINSEHDKRKSDLLELDECLSGLDVDPKAISVALRFLHTEFFDFEIAPEIAMQVANIAERFGNETLKNGGN